MTDILTETDDSLTHFGVKGMHWGVRHEVDSHGHATGKATVEPQPVFSKTFSTGDSVHIYKDPPSFIVKALSARFPKYKAGAEKVAFFTLKDKDGTKVGDAQFFKDSPDSLNLVWLGIKTKHRGKGYASAAMQGVVQYARNEGLSKLTLEVPGTAPDALHIYTKLGFKVDKVQSDKASSDTSDAWGGLTSMTYDVNSVKHAQEDFSGWERQYADEFAAFLSDNLPNGELKHSSSDETLTESRRWTMSIIPDELSEDSLAHFGVKGMHWGIRHPVDASTGRITGGSETGSSSRASTTVATAKKGLTRNQKIAIGVGAAAVVALGTAAVVYNMKTGGKLSMGALNTGKAALSKLRGQKETKRRFDSLGDVIDKARAKNATRRFDTLGDIIDKSRAKNATRRFDTLGDVIDKAKADNAKRRFDTLGDIMDKARAKNATRRFDTLGDIIDKSKARNAKRQFDGLDEVSRIVKADISASIARQRANLAEATAKSSAKALKRAANPRQFDTLADLIDKHRANQAKWTPSDVVAGKIKKRLGF